MTKLIHPSQNPFGQYWLVGDKKIYNQFEAVKTALTPGSPAYRYVFLEDQYDKLNWQQEPEKSWDELCIERALAIRQKYRKLKLLFSAGRDSGHVWRVFEQANIPIDELITYYTPYHPLRKAEYEYQIKPIIQELCRKNPAMKVTVLVIDKDQFEYQMRNSDWLESDTTTSAQLLYLPYRFGEVLTTMDPESLDPSVGYIAGLEKPRLRLIDGNFVFRHLDNDGGYHVINMPNLEWFYWAPEMPELFLKQCWMVVNYLEEHYPGCTPEFIEKFQSAHDGYYDEYCFSVGRGPAMSWDCGNGTNKPKDSYHWSLQRVIQHASQENWKSYNEWNSIMQDLKRNLSYCFNGGDPMKGLIGIWGKPYIIKKQTLV